MVILEKCLLLTKNCLLKSYFEEDQSFNGTITFHLLGQYSLILTYIFSQHNPIEDGNKITLCAHSSQLNSYPIWGGSGRF